MNVESKDSCCGMSAKVPFVPLPVAFVTMFFGFICGVMVGKAISHKRDMMMGGGMGQPMMQGGWGGPMMHHGMKGHHHHGEGSPACREWHGGWPAESTPPEES